MPQNLVNISKLPDKTFECLNQALDWRMGPQVLMFSYQLNHTPGSAELEPEQTFSQSSFETNAFRFPPHPP